ncbi:DUF2849 domain-containing protein [Sneathiella sp. P13V-1]|uniref:DUF2849 domain-containing protein n=1 Tax=Sneathiella sp. P13V-1 TaxID=2697366 RepID=UPI00187B4C83|nr:DUF2849 domain-containing protein [Sneathiella sp. P13V-1]MBE7636541.1 DUF2849 domain-containing protein [Sneathiella sp. P13V-1]
MTYKIYTASLLKEGLVAYLSLRDGEAVWTTDFTNATSTEQVAEETLKLEADRGEQNNIIVGPYTVDVTSEDGRLVPLENRERIRAGGPTIKLPISGKTKQHTQAAA